jgi:hypothetical protein
MAGSPRNWFSTWGAQPGKALALDALLNPGGFYGRPKVGLFITAWPLRYSAGPCGRNRGKGRNTDCGRRNRSRVEERRGAAYAAGFLFPLIKPDAWSSRIRLSDWFHRGHLACISTTRSGPGVRPKAGPRACLVAGLRSSRLPDQTALQLPGRPTVSRMRLSLLSQHAPWGAPVGTEPRRPRLAGTPRLRVHRALRLLRAKTTPEQAPLALRVCPACRTGAAADLAGGRKNSPSREFMLT